MSCNIDLVYRVKQGDYWRSNYKGPQLRSSSCCLSACSLKDIGRQTGPISFFASQPHRKSLWVMAPGSAISSVHQIGGGLITSLRRCVMKLSAPSELSSSFSSRTPSLSVFLHHCSVNSAFTLSVAVFGLQLFFYLILTCFFLLISELSTSEVNATF